MSVNRTLQYGLSTFPWDYAANPADDGLLIRYATLPGGTERNYNLGQVRSLGYHHINMEN